MQLTHSRIIIIIPLMVGIIAGCMLYCFNPVRYTFYPPCLFKKLTGLNCPGCGSARALHALLHGQLSQAIDYNLLVILFMPIIIAGLIYFYTGKGGELWSKLNKPILYFIIICLFFILRNSHVYPFVLLNSDK